MPPLGKKKLYKKILSMEPWIETRYQQLVKEFKNFSHYHMRVTTDDDLDVAYEKIRSMSVKPVKKIEQVFLWVVATEVSKAGVKHFHAKIITTMSKETLRARLKLIYPSSGYSISVEKTDNNLSYVLKCGTFRSCPELLELVTLTPKWVFPEKKVEPFEKSMALLEGKYINGSLSDMDFVMELLGLYAEFNKTIYIAHIRAKWLGVANRRNLPITTRYQGDDPQRPFRKAIALEIMRGFFIYDN